MAEFPRRVFPVLSAFILDAPLSHAAQPPDPVTSDERYEELAPILLGEVQKQQQRIEAQDARTQGLEQQVAQVNDLESKINAIGASLGASRPENEVKAQR